MAGLDRLTRLTAASSAAAKPSISDRGSLGGWPSDRPGARRQTAPTKPTGKREARIVTSLLLGSLQDVAHQLRRPGRLQSRLPVEIAQARPDLGEVVLPPGLRPIFEPGEAGAH